MIVQSLAGCQWLLVSGTSEENTGDGGQWRASLTALLLGATIYDPLNWPVKNHRTTLCFIMIE